METKKIKLFMTGPLGNDKFLGLPEVTAYVDAATDSNDHYSGQSQHI